jgi:hypothetical protein
MANQQTHPSNAERHRGEHENEERHIPGPLGGHEKNKQTGINAEGGTTAEFIEEMDNEKLREPRRHKGGTVDDKDTKGLWHPDDGIPEEKE